MRRTSLRPSSKTMDVEDGHLFAIQCRINFAPTHLHQKCFQSLDQVAIRLRGKIKGNLRTLWNNPGPRIGEPANHKALLSQEKGLTQEEIAEIVVVGFVAEKQCLDEQLFERLQDVVHQGCRDILRGLEKQRTLLPLQAGDLRFA